MRIINRILSILIVLLMILNSGMAFADEPLKDEKVAADIEAGDADGQTVGKSLGAIDGRKDFRDGNKSDYNNSMPKDADIINDYHLNNDNDDYKDAFIKGFKEAYKKSYEETYRASNLESILNPTAAAVAGDIDGRAMGEIFGAIYGREDYINGKENNYRLYINDDSKIIDADLIAIINNLHLEKDVEEYKEAFLDGFKAAFKTSYVEAYRAANLDDPATDSGAGYKDGSSIGESLGAIDGRKDFRDKRQNDYTQSINGYTDVINPYLLANESEEYKVAFLNGFKEAYKKAYEEAYRTANLESMLNPAAAAAAGDIDGRAMGEIFGAIYGREDYINGKGNNYRSYINDDSKIIDADLIKIINNLNLDEDVIEYKEAFLDGFKAAFKTSYVESYRAANLDDPATDSGAGYKDGSSIGESLGAIDGRKDFRYGNKNDYTNLIPKDIEIIDSYLLEKESEEYKVAFLNGFKEAYKKAYEEAYRTANLESPTSSYEAGMRDGSDVGKNVGKTFGRKDCLDGKNNNFSSQLPSDLEIIADYNLSGDSSEYQDAFISGYKEAFKSSYEEAYRTANLENQQTAAYKNGFNKGENDGKAVAGKNGGDVLKPFNMVKLTDKQVEEKYKELLSEQNSKYKIEFVMGYQDGFKEGYDSIQDINTIYQDGKSKGYAYGKSLADKSNSEKTYVPFEKVKMDSSRVITINYSYLKDKDSDFISKFVEGYLEGFEQGYRDTILTEKEEETKLPVTTADFGAELGALYGEMAGRKDYEDGKSPKWSKAIPSDSRLSRMFDLSGLTNADRAQFLDKFSDSFKKSYENAYYNAHFNSFRTSLEAGKDDGATFGAMLGKTFGIYDYYKGKSSSYTRNMPSDKTITSEYSLSLDDSEYKEGFLSSFKKAYKDSYIESFRETKNNALLSDESNAYENGSEAGVEAGKMQANIDQLSNDNNNWKKHLPSASTITANYNLSLQTEKYRDSFISGFCDGYMNGYTDTYKEISQDVAMDRNTFQNVPISGADLNSLDNGFVLSISKGTYFRPIVVTIEAIESSVVNYNNSFMPASNVYKVDIVNPSNNYDDKKDIVLSFEYYGNPINGGIYKRINNNWEYIPSTIDRENGVISACVKPSSLAYAMTYGVFIDNNTAVFRDVRGHWASDEIDAYVRRGVISGYADMAFKPDNNITRAEFLTLLSRVFNWNPYSYPGSTATFKDGDTFGYYADVISYAYQHNYINGYGDGTFKPGNTISYAEVETIMNRVLFYGSFRWSNIANKMLYEKKERCASFKNMNNKITRAEVAYMLYNTTE